MKKLFLTILLLIGICANASATVVLQVEDGKLAGATGVIVNGDSYDVSFVNGNCFEFYEGCGWWNFPFGYSREIAGVASQALLDQVFVGVYDDNPSLVRGCVFNVAGCFTRTPIFSGQDQWGDKLIVRTVDIVNWSLDTETQYSYYVDHVNNNSDTSIYAVDNSSYAIWSRSAPAIIPEPSTIAMLGLASIALFLSQRRRLR